MGLCLRARQASADQTRATAADGSDPPCSRPAPILSFHAISPFLRRRCGFGLSRGGTTPVCRSPAGRPPDRERAESGDGRAGARGCGRGRERSSLCALPAYQHWLGDGRAGAPAQWVVERLRAWGQTRGGVRWQVTGAQAPAGAPFLGRAVAPLARRRAAPRGTALRLGRPLSLTRTALGALGRAEGCACRTSHAARGGEP